jgi:cytochrome c peroxidase
VYNLAGRYNGTMQPAEIRKTTTVKIGQSNFGQWKTPSLRNLTRTAPYMHDGSLKTLREVVDSYADIDPSRLHTQGESILKPQQWSDSEREDLVTFLQTLSD